MYILALTLLAFLPILTITMFFVIQGRFIRYSIGFLILGVILFIFFAYYRADICTEYFCGLGNYFYGGIAMFISFIVAAIFAAFGSKGAKKKRKKDPLNKATLFLRIMLVVLILIPLLAASSTLLPEKPHTAGLVRVSYTEKHFVDNVSTFRGLELNKSGSSIEATTSLGLSSTCISSMAVKPPGVSHDISLKTFRIYIKVDVCDSLSSLPQNNKLTVSIPNLPTDKYRVMAIVTEREGLTRKEIDRYIFTKFIVL